MKSFIFDFETLGNSPDGVVIDLSCLVVDLDNIENPPSFMDLVKSAKKWKIDVKSQIDRKIEPKVLEWWKKQSDEAKQSLVQNGTEIYLKQVIDEFNDYLYQNGFDRKTGLGFCRGQSFDFPLLIDILKKAKRNFRYI